MHLRPLPFLLAGLAATAPLSARDRGVPDATPDGKPVSCLSLSQIRQSHVRSDSVIDFEMTGHRIYRNTLPHACPQLGFEERFAYATSLSELCSTDIITVLQSGGLTRGASCGLGQFQPVTLSK